MNLSKILVFLFAHIYGHCFGYVNDQGDQLIGVTVIYRHGDRGPISSYPNDPYHDIKYWPNGFGQLLDKGKSRHFNLGRWLRSRYNSFISERYNYQDIFVRSTDVDRTLMSASSNLAGFYYPTDESFYWQKNLAWDPIPIHTEPQENDEILAMSKKCPNFEKLYEAILHSTYFQSILQEYDDIKAFVEKNTGWNITDITTYQGLFTVFYVYSMHNSSYLPKWADEIDMNELSYLAGLSFSTETFTTELQRYKIGPFFNYLHTYFEGIINGTNPKFLMLSAHDGNIAGILNTYGVYDYHPPEFGETIIWELYKSTDNNIYLKIYNKRDNENLKEIHLKNCSQQCDFDQYIEILQPVSVNSIKWEVECNDI